MNKAIVILKFIFLFIACVAFSTTKIGAQSLDFSHLSVENGLSQKSVLAIAQDSRGFLWLGTADGLSRYDSRNFKNYLDDQSKNSLSSSYILSLLSDSKQKLWVGTTRGLNIYRPQTDDFELVQLSKNSNSANRYIINCLTEDRHQRIWVGSTTGLYLLWVDGSGKHVLSFFAHAFNGLAGNNIHSIAEDNAGNIWVGTDKGLTKMQPNGNTFSFQTFHHTNHSGSLAGDNISSIAWDEFNNLWIGLQQNGLDLYNAVTNTFTHYADPYDADNGSENIRKIISGNDGKLWIGTQAGLISFDIKNKDFFIYKHDPNNSKSLNQNSLYSLFIDKQNTLWVGTYFGGVNITTPSIFNKYQSTNTSSGINNNVISSIIEDKSHNLWVGTEGGGLNYLQRKDKPVIIYQHQKNNPSSISSDLIKVVYQDQDRNIWIGTHGGGLNVLLPGQKTFIKYFYRENDADIANSEIRSIVESDNGLFFIGTNNGLQVFKRYNSRLTPYPDTVLSGNLRAQAVNCLITDSKKRTWAAAWGLYVLEKGMKRFMPVDISVKKNESLIRLHINCITEDDIGNIWIGTDRHGVLRYNPANKRVIAYSENDGLANNSVYGIVQDEQGNMWISTGNGLSNLNVRTSIFHNYTTRDGLAGNEFNNNSCVRLKDGEILFGGFNGFTGFFPKNIKDKTDKPIAFISGLKIFNKPVEVGDENKILSTDISQSKTITLKYTQNVFTIDFIILNYIRAEKNKYAYEIENIDKNWNYTNNPSATYNNLPAGQYHFLAKGRTNDGIWSEPVSLIINVLPPWWQTWWVYSLYILAFAGIVFLIVRYFFLRALMKRDKQLTELKLNFFNNISHEIRTYLSLISAPIERLLLAGKGTDSDIHQFQTIKKNTDGLLELVNELMDFRKAETGNLQLHVSKFNIVPFVQSICESFESMALSKNIVTKFLTDAEQIELYFDREQMKKVIFNLLSNAYKFTPERGLVSITIEDNTSQVSIKIADNGKGISPENIQGLFRNYFQENDYGHQNTGYGIGLALSKSIITLHSGELTVESFIPTNENDISTIFTIILKKGNIHFENGQLIPVSYDFQPQTNDIQKIIKTLELVVTEMTPADISARKYSLLIVEDNSDVRKFIADTFSHLYFILEAQNGRVGFEIATEQIPDIIVSDVMMPEMDGYTFCHKIKTDERTNHIPVILLTAKASTTNHVNGLQVGADIYLTKPFSVQILELHIHNLLASAERLRKKYSEQVVALTPLNNLLIHNCTIVQEKNITENEFINKIVAIAEAGISNPNFDVEMICSQIGMSQTVLYKKVRALTNMTINDIVKEVRFKKSAELLCQNKYTIYEVADMVGYNDTKYFSREFKKQFGVSPRDYKQRQTL